MAEIPSSVQVGPYRFAVTQDQVAYERKAVADHAATWGYIEYGRLRIILNPDQAEDHMRVTLLHEILHAVEDVTDQRHHRTEEIIRQLAAPLLDVLRRNPDLVAYLTGKE